MTEVNWSYETLAEAEVFRLADEAADRRRGAPVQPQGVEAIHNLFRHRCCGYQIPPKAEDVVRGLRKGTWSDREHRAIVSMFRESLPEELVFAWERGAYSLRDLVSALHKTGRGEGWDPRIGVLNRIASDTNPQGWRAS